MKKTMFVFSSGVLKRKDNTLYLETEQGKKFIPVEDTKEIYVFGDIDINKRLLEFLTQKEILIHFFNHYGYFIGSYYPREHLNSGFMVLKQAEAYLDNEKRLDIARRFLKGGAANIRQVLMYYKNRGRELELIIQAIDDLILEISLAGSTEHLMAVEGNIRQHYYKAFDIILNNSDFLFEKRTKQPPKNRLNALISFGNSLVYTMVLSEIYKTHLDPRIGYLHTTNFRRFTLNLDIAEIFKPIIVDRLIFKLISKRMITKKDFHNDLGGIFLSDKGRQVFVSELDSRMRTTISYRKLNRQVSYRRLLRLEAYKLEKHLIGEYSYEPYIARW